MIHGSNFLSQNRGDWTPSLQTAQENPNSDQQVSKYGGMAQNPERAAAASAMATILGASFNPRAKLAAALLSQCRRSKLISGIARKEWAAVSFSRQVRKLTNGAVEGIISTSAAVLATTGPR